MVEAFCPSTARLMHACTQARLSIVWAKGTQQDAQCTRMHTYILRAHKHTQVVLARLALPQTTALRTLWVLDEPFNALDVAAAEWLSALVRTHLARGGIVVLTSHQSIPLDGLADPLTVSLGAGNPVSA